MSVEQKPKVAWVFPGQGSQFVGMAADLYVTYPGVKKTLDVANDTLGPFSTGSGGKFLTELMFEGPIEVLTETRVTQPGLLAYGEVCRELFEDENNGDFSEWEISTSGHSLGLYTALVAAGALSFEEALRLVQIRGEAMQEACIQNPGGLYVVRMETSEENEAELINLVSPIGVDVASVNNGEQFVVGGLKKSLDQLPALLEPARIRGFLLKGVAGPFHTRHMQPARERLLPALESSPIKPPVVGIVGNTKAWVLETVEQIRQELEAQLTSAVRWKDAVLKLRQEGVQRFVEFGTKTTLTDMNPKIIGEGRAEKILTSLGLHIATSWEPVTS